MQLTKRTIGLIPLFNDLATTLFCAECLNLMKNVKHMRYNKTVFFAIFSKTIKNFEISLSNVVSNSVEHLFFY